MSRVFGSLGWVNLGCSVCDVPTPHELAFHRDARMNIICAEEEAIQSATCGLGQAFFLCALRWRARRFSPGQWRGRQIAS
jgi:hypothetical protein